MKGRSEMKKFGRFIKCTAVAAVCALTFTGCENYNKMMEEEPQEYINLASENTAEAMVKSAFAEEAAVIEKALKDGTMGFSFDIEGVKFNADAYVNEADKKSSQLYSLAIGENKVDIYAAVNDEIAKFGAIGNSGENIFEINAKTLADDLAGSVFAPGSGSSMELSQEDYDMIVDAIKELTTAVEGGNTEELPEEYAEIEAFVDEIMSEVQVEKKADVTIDETEVKANILTFKMDKEDMKKLMDIYVDIALEEMAAQGEEINKEEMTAEFNTVMESIEKSDIELVYYVNSKSHCLMEMDCNIDMTVKEGEESQNVKVDMTVTYGAEPETSDTVVINIAIDAAGETMTADIVSERKSEDETEVKISAAMQGMTMEVVTLNFKKDGENYTIAANVPVVEATATVNGTFKSDSKSVEATVDKVSYAMKTEEIEGNVENLNIKAYIKQGGEYDDRAAKNFFSLTEEELTTAVESIINDFGALAGETNAGGAMIDYIDKSKQVSADANAKTVYTAFSAALTEMAVAGETFEDFEFNNTSVTSTGYELNIADYLGDSFEGYYYAYVNPYDYMVEYAIWSDSPIEYPWHYSKEDIEWLAEEGTQLGCYPLADYSEY